VEQRVRPPEFRPFAIPLRAAAAYFGLVFAAGFVLGSIRVPFLVPRLGERTAELLETPVMLVVVVFAARLIVRRFSLPRSFAVRGGVGAVALALLVLAELLLAVVIQNRSLSAYVASRDPISGSVYLGALLLFAAMPSLLLCFDERATRVQ
jgi:hypothetical protein